MTTQRAEAADPGTVAERLHELILLDGDRGDIDSDSGSCRELVAANPSASPQTLDELSRDSRDHLVRLGVAGNPSTHPATLGSLAADENDLVADAARERLGMARRDAGGVRIPGTDFFFDPSTGQVGYRL